MSVAAQAKIIIMGSHGGVDTYDSIGIFGANNDGYNYDPLTTYKGSDPQSVLAGERGVVTAVPLAIASQISQPVVARISGDTPRVEKMVEWFGKNYSPGDKIYLVGYSAGGKFIVNLAEALPNYQIDGMFLVDAYVDGGSREIPANVNRVAVYHQRTWRKMLESKGLVGFRFYGLTGNATVFSNSPDKLCAASHMDIDNNTQVFQDIVAKIKGLIDGKIHTGRAGGSRCPRTIKQLFSDGYKWLEEGILSLIRTPTLHAAGSNAATYTNSQIEELEVDVQEQWGQVTIEFMDRPGIIHKIDVDNTSGMIGGLAPKIGPKPDHTPDFDVFYPKENERYEISANREGENGKPVWPGMNLLMRLEAETTNRAVEGYDLRDSKSDSIDGKISCRIKGKTGWEEIPGSEDELEFNVSNLKTKDGTSVERVVYTVPNYVGSTLECQAFVDDDDEVIEESEGNNASRIERFTIVSKPTYSLRTNNVRLVRKSFVYTGGKYGLGAHAWNAGQYVPYTDHRMHYQIELSPNNWVTIEGDNLDPKEMPVGGGAIWEQMNKDTATAPNRPGNYRIRAIIGGVPNSESYGTLQVRARPTPQLSIVGFRDNKGCCTTNRGKKVYPRIWVRNTGPVAPSHNIYVRYYINSRGTGYHWWHIDNDVIEPRELPPGGTDEERINQGWRIPTSNKNGWKKTWHTIRACVNIYGRWPTNGGHGDICADYRRFSKK